MTNPGRSVSPEEVRLVLKGWLQSDALIRCEGRIGPSVFRLTGELFVTGSHDIGVRSEAGTFSFGLQPDFDLMYAEPRDFPESAAELVCSLFFIFPNHSGYFNESDFITLAELKTSH